VKKEEEKKQQEEDSKTPAIQVQKNLALSIDST